MKTNDLTVRQQEIGEQLRALRTKASLSLDETASVINCSVSRLSRLETGHRRVPIEDIASLLTLYRADHDQRAYVLALARGSDTIGWLQSKDSATAHRQYSLSTLESKAKEIISFDPTVIPRFLQISEYRCAALAQSVTVPANDIDDDRPDVSACRQPPKRLAILDESVLHRPLGGWEVLRRQLEHLREAAADKDWTIHMVPRGQTIASSAFTLLRLPDRPPVIIHEHPTCRLFLERPHDIEAYEQTLRQLSAQTLDETESFELISNALERL